MVFVNKAVLNSTPELPFTFLVCATLPLLFNHTTDVHALLFF